MAVGPDDPVPGKGLYTAHGVKYPDYLTGPMVKARL
jgi:hypothetical protein